MKKIKSKNMKNKLILFLCLLSFCSLFAQNDASELEKYLSQQKDLTFKKISTSDNLPLKYELQVKQPVDWKDTKKGYFTQKVILIHTGFTNPTLIETQGYQMYDRNNELQQILNSNDINVEHRYFGESKPDSDHLDWKCLNLYNVTHDLHHINQIFKKIYKGKWISSGISKGGQTTIYYRYFFPDDVDVSIPYVAPVNYTLEDPRIYTFLNNVGTPECRQKVKDFQLFLLKNEEEALKYIQINSDKRGLTYSYVGSTGTAFEYAVLEYSFSFWQWGYPCSEIPQNPTVQEAVDYLLKNSDISFFSDQEINGYAPHYYQAATEMGYYGYDITPFKPYLKHFKENPFATFPPKEAGKTVYSEKLNDNLKKWLDKKANNIIYIYGGIDTWSATKVNPSSKTNSVILEIPGANHRSARIKNMDSQMKEKLSETLYNWIGIKPDYNLIN